MRNFLYNKSDILVAIIIIAVAAVIIWTRVDAIMDSENSSDTPTVTTGELPIPDAETSEGAVEAPPVIEDDNPDADGTDEAPPDSDGDGDGDEDSGDAGDGEPIEFVIEVGSAANTVAKDLESAGLVDDAKTFLNELTAQNAETKLKAGEFKIAPGTSVSDIVKKLTN